MNVTRIVLGSDCGSVCVASTCSTSEVPMPKASAPNAPWVEVWLSPQTIVMPGLRHAELRPDHVDDPLAAAAGREQAHPELLAVRRQRVELRLRELVGDRPCDRGDVVIHRRYRQLGPPHGPAVQPERLERLRARHLVHEMKVDVEERRRALLLGDDVRIPDLAKQRAHRSRSAA